MAQTFVVRISMFIVRISRVFSMGNLVDIPTLPG